MYTHRKLETSNSMSKKNLRAFLDKLDEEPSMQQELMDIARNRDPEGPDDIESLVSRFAAKLGFVLALPILNSSLRKQMISRLELEAGC